MTSKLNEELERLSKAATQGVWGISAYYTGTGPDEKCCGLVEVEDFPIGIIDEEGATAESLSPNLEFVTTLVNAYRTGQLVPAQPSGDATAAAFEVGQQAYERIGVTPAMREVMELCKSNRAATSQPSGDEVEAVARAIFDAAPFRDNAGSFSEQSEEYQRLTKLYATAAIARLDAHRGKQACLKARENSDG